MTEYRSLYDSLIIQYMLAKDKSGQYSATEIYNMIKKYGKPKGKKKVPGKDTIQRHLKIMVEANVLVRCKEGGLFNKTLYNLSPQTIASLSSPKLITWLRKEIFQSL